jgi:hypothetical protein
VDAHGFDVSARSELARERGGDRGLQDERARLPARHEAAVGPRPAVGERLTEERRAGPPRRPLERATPRADDRDRPEDAPDALDAGERRRRPNPSRSSYDG